MQLARCPSSRVRTSAFTPSHVDRKRVTSFMHSLKPARYLPSTVGSAFRAAARGETQNHHEFHLNTTITTLLASALSVTSSRCVMCYTVRFTRVHALTSCSSYTSYFSFPKRKSWTLKRAREHSSVRASTSKPCTNSVCVCARARLEEMHHASFCNI